MAPMPDGMGADRYNERQNMREARAFEKAHKGDWRLLAHRPHPTTNQVIEEVWGYYDSEAEANAAKARKESPALNVTLGVEQVE